MGKTIIAAFQTILAILLFASYFATEDLGSLVIACMLVVIIKVDYLTEKISGNK